ncbi:SAM and SH3 domain-containing 1-like isoform X1 [Labeo rohita]|uniref:SAM and SH3 domain-containing 1-like isoform X1 n=1 Tax=Labeo rohita TaxID=84645 RepID=A0A498LXD4_LABRO|nr:SAM and SH3 domain-containing 1-like isoform X1 [Labeo rohita]
MSYVILLETICHGLLWQHAGVRDVTALLTFAGIHQITAGTPTWPRLGHDARATRYAQLDQRSISPQDIAADTEIQLAVRDITITGSTVITAVRLASRRNIPQRAASPAHERQLESFLSMNLFDIGADQTADGSTDSLYEPAQIGQNSQDLLPKRLPSPKYMKNVGVWSGSEPCIAMKVPETHTSPNYYQHQKMRLQIIQSLMPTGRPPEKKTALYTARTIRTQGVNFEAWNPNRENSECRQQDVTRRSESEDEAQGTLKKIQKLVGVKKGSQSVTEETRNNTEPGESTGKGHSPVITCISLTKKAEKKPTRTSTQQSQQDKDVDTTKTEASWSPGLFQEYWSPMAYSPAWDTSTHTCHRSTAEQVMYNFNFTLPRDTDWEKYEELFHRLDPYKREQQDRWITHSVMDLDTPDPLRSTSFGIFDRQQPTQVKAEEKAESLPVEVAEVDPSKSGGLGKKMKNISLTMRKKMGRKYTKALSEEMGEENEAAAGDGVDGVLAKGCNHSSNSVESLFSLHSGQSSSSGVTSGSEGCSNRDSLRLEDDVPYTGQFCGRAKVHTDFVPSPYDTESLKLKVGDVIDIISKPAMGIWSGMLNGKIGSFKFIYVDLLVEESAPEPRIRSHRRSRRPRPKTLQELLERLNLEEHISSLLLNGYQTVEDLRDLKEQHLVELNVTDPEHRHRLLLAAEYLQDPEYNNQSHGETEEEPKSPSEEVKAELNDCPRDSGCYIGSDCSDNSKEDTESQPAPLSPPATQA